RAGALVLLVFLAGILIGVVIAFARIGLAGLPQFLDRVLPGLESAATRFGVDLPIDNAGELKTYILNAARANARLLTAEGGLLTRGFFQFLLVAVAAVLAFLAPSRAAAGAPGNLDAAVRRECAARAATFRICFERVMGAQFVIAAINAAATAVFLFALRIPFRTMLLLATFFLGVIPIAGNIASNVLIVATALTVSGSTAVAALAFLLVSHKAQYFLNGRLVGDRIDTPTWAILVSLVLGEALMGLPGAILAPTLLHYAREELRARPAR
ncbi:MAG: AI-2E family transporter, partial [Elusimicrobia bacterium]|nr:AI-2E family transporter [Elusimicrobiota bacterium]